MTLKLISKQILVDNVWAFRFQPSEPMTWEAGQFVQVELLHDTPDKEGTRRWFTNSAAPYEGILQITTRVTDSTFKQALSKVVGEELLLLEKPDGDFIWQENNQPKVFIAGGIGITPFYSMIKQRVHVQQPVKLTLFYSNRTERIPFKKELGEWAETHKELRIHNFINEPMSVEKLESLAPDLKKSLIYVSGPEPMVEALGDQLKATGVPNAMLMQDFFPNYTESNY